MIFSDKYNRVQYSYSRSLYILRCRLFLCNLWCPLFYNCLCRSSVWSLNWNSIEKSQSKWNLSISRSIAGYICQLYKNLHPHKCQDKNEHNELFQYHRSRDSFIKISGNQVRLLGLTLKNELNISIENKYLKLFLGAFTNSFPRTPLWYTNLGIAKFSLRWFSTTWIRWTVSISGSFSTTTCFWAIGPFHP